MATAKTSKDLLAEVLLDAARMLKSGGAMKPVRVGITTLGSELGAAELVRGAELARALNLGIEPVLIGDSADSSLETHACDQEEEQHKIMEQLLDSGQIDGCVTAHYPFPIGVSTVGRVITPALGKEVYIATSTGTSDTERVQAMVKNAVYGIAAAKAAGVANPRVGILNLDGARQVEQHLEKMRHNGYQFEWGASARADGGRVLRGNDLLMGTIDVAVTDTLTGNLLMKIFSAYTSGGSYESLGYGYGPGIGPGFNRLVMIISRASGAPVIAGAIKYCADIVRGKIMDVAAREIAAAEKAGWKVEKPKKDTNENKIITAPPAKPVTSQLSGIDILQLEDAVQCLWAAGVYASSGMGCTGPVLLVADEDRNQAQALLSDKGFI
ncbi:MAG: glycine/sarcosine/betaine reductase complex component C subunit alpha [Methylocystaceae bacterium]